jgi:hypothetical protein
MADTLQVYGNPTLHLLGPKDAGTARCHLHQERGQGAFECDRESCEIAEKLAASA